MHLNNRKVLLGNIVILLVNLLLFYKFNVPVEPILLQPPTTSTAKPETPVIEEASTERPKEKEDDHISQKNQNLYAKFQIEDYEEIVNEIVDRNDLEQIIEKSQNLTSNIKIQAPILLETMLFQPKLILGNFNFSEKEKKDSKKCSGKKNIMFAYGFIQLGSSFVSAIALAAIAFGFCSVKKESKLFNKCVVEIIEDGGTNSEAVRYCNGGN